MKHKVKKILIQFTTIETACIFIPFVVLIIAVINITTSFIGFKQYGDGILLPHILAQPDKFAAAKYLIGAEIIRSIYAAVWQCPFISSLIPPAFGGWDGCLKTVGVLSMFFSVVFMFAGKYERVQVLIVILSPCWILFATGYMEYYPVITGVYCVTLCYLSATPIIERAPHQIALIVSALPLLYLGFAPVSLIILIIYCFRNWQRAGTTILYCLGIFIVLVAIFWPGPLHTFFKELYSEMNFGNKNIIYKPYLAHSAGQNSIFFSLEYAISGEHLFSIGRLLLIGVGVIPLVSLLYLIIYQFKNYKLRVLLRSRDHWLIFLLLLWSFIYLIFMLPKFGIEKDFDLFFISYFTITFYSAKVITHFPQQKMPLILFFLISSLVSMVFMT